MRWLKKIFLIKQSDDFSGKEEMNLQLTEMQNIFSDTNLAFREGFADRVAFKLERLLELNSEDIYYRNLSRFLPKMAALSLGAIVFVSIVIFIIHGSLSPDKLIGAEKIDETNFISYLIMQK